MIFFIKNSPICMWFEADNAEKIQKKLVYLISFSEKCLIKKVTDEQSVKILGALQYLLNIFSRKPHRCVRFVHFLNCLQQAPCKSDHYL